MNSIISRSLLWTAVLGICLAAFGAQAKGYNQSGITGQVVGLPTSVTQCFILVVSTEKRNFAQVFSTDDQLRFRIALKPGNYVLVPFVASGSGDPEIAPGTPVPVQVFRKTFSEITLTYTPES